MTFRHKNTKSSEVSFNPNYITRVNNPEDVFWDLGIYTAKFAEFSCPEEIAREKPIIENSRLIYQTVNKAKEILKEEKLEAMEPYMVPILVPVFGKGNPKRHEQGVGFKDVPFLKRQYRNGKLNYPRCGLCHKPMKFVAQFDLRNWAMPLLAVLGNCSDRYQCGPLGTSTPWKYDEFNTIQAFMCPYGGHYNNGATEAKIYIQSDFTKEQSENPEYLKEVIKIRREINRIEAESRMAVETKKIVDWSFRVTFDIPEYYDDEPQDLSKKYPDVFHNGYQEFSLLGRPRSQQTEKRFYGTSGYSEPYRQTPLFAFNDDKQDMTYQVYIDFMMSPSEMRDEYGGLIDSSCT